MAGSVVTRSTADRIQVALEDAASGLEDGCFGCPRRTERDRYLLALDDIYNARGDPQEIAKLAMAGKTWETWTR